MQGVGEEIEAPGGDHLRIQLAQGAGAGVARIGEQCLATAFPFVVDGRERVIRDEGFAPHLHPFGRVIDLQAQGDRGDRAHVGGDLFTAAAISPGGGAFQHTAVVTQCKGVAIDLQFSDHLQRCVGGPVDHLEQPFVPGVEVVAVEGVIQAQQPDPVLHAGEALCRSTPHALGWAVRPLQARILLLQLEQLLVEAVVDRVLHQG